MALCLNTNVAYKDFQMLSQDKFFVDKTAIIEKNLPLKIICTLV